MESSHEPKHCCKGQAGDYDVTSLINDVSYIFGKDDENYYDTYDHDNDGNDYLPEHKTEVGCPGEPKYSAWAPFTSS